MFRNILLPTDGSALAARGIKAGVKLAKSLRARVTGVYVMAPYTPPLYGEGAMYVPALAPSEYRKVAEKQAARALEALKREAKAAGVRCDTVALTDPQPFRGILKAARSRKCDAISMSSHGRGGLGGLILGSETTRVLAHSKIPVLVTR